LAQFQIMVGIILKGLEVMVYNQQYPLNQVYVKWKEGHSKHIQIQPSGVYIALIWAQLTVLGCHKSGTVYIGINTYRLTLQLKSALTPSTLPISITMVTPIIWGHNISNLTCLETTLIRHHLYTKDK